MSQQGHTDLAEAQSDSDAGMVFLNNVSCTHEKCGQASVSVSAVGTDHGQAKTTHAVAANVIHLPMNLLLRADLKGGASPPEVAATSPTSIHLELRLI